MVYKTILAISTSMEVEHICIIYSYESLVHVLPQVQAAYENKPLKLHISF